MRDQLREGRDEGSKRLEGWLGLDKAVMGFGLWAGLWYVVLCCVILCYFVLRYAIKWWVVIRCDT